MSKPKGDRTKNGTNSDEEKKQSQSMVNLQLENEAEKPYQSVDKVEVMKRKSSLEPVFEANIDYRKKKNDALNTHGNSPNVFAESNLKSLRYDHEL